MGIVIFLSADRIFIILYYFKKLRSFIEH